MTSLLFAFSLFLSFSVGSIFPFSTSNGPAVNDTLQNAIRSQRDVSKPIPIDRVGFSGVSLSSFFESEGYSSDSLSNLNGLLKENVDGVMIDLYWNEFTSKWQLCPAPFPNNITYTTASNRIVDVLWNNKTYKCDPNLSTDNIMSILNSFIRDTNTDVEANFMHVMYNLKSIHYEKSNQTISLENIYKEKNSNLNVVGMDTLNDTVSLLSSYIFTPTLLKQYQSTSNKYTNSSSSIRYIDSLNETQAIQDFYSQSTILMPSLQTVLLTQYKRLMVHVVSNNMAESSRSYQISSSDKDTIFFNSDLPALIFHTDNALADELCYELSDAYNGTDVNIAEFNKVLLNATLRLVVDDDKTPFTTKSLSKYVRCGYCPIFNSTEYSSQKVTEGNSLIISREFASNLFWSWAPGQPSGPDNCINCTRPTTNNTSKHSDDNGEEEEEGNNIAYKCVALTEEGWEVSNCYEKYLFACQNKLSRNEWKLNNSTKRNYFDIDDDDCPEGYFFSLPRLNIEMLSLMTTVKQENVNYPIWIDLNDITVANCFVSGGPYAQCPYQETVTTDKFVRMIAPSFVVAMVVLVLIFIEKVFRKTPIQTNRKRYWKKAIQEYYAKNDYEGVPS